MNPEKSLNFWIKSGKWLHTYLHSKSGIQNFQLCNRWCAKGNRIRKLDGYFKRDMVKILLVNIGYCCSKVESWRRIAEYNQRRSQLRQQVTCSIRTYYVCIRMLRYAVKRHFVVIMPFLLCIMVAAFPITKAFAGLVKNHDVFIQVIVYMVVMRNNRMHQCNRIYRQNEICYGFPEFHDCKDKGIFWYGWKYLALFILLLYRRRSANVMSIYQTDKISAMFYSPTAKIGMFGGNHGNRDVKITLWPFSLFVLTILLSSLEHSKIILTSV